MEFWKNKNSLLLITLLVCSNILRGQTNSMDPKLVSQIEAERYFRVMFYNCENLFDIYDDSLTNDNEFLPKGEKYWSKNRYYTKLNQISKVITAVGGWKAPEIVGLCEVENKKVLNDLIYNTQLYRSEYKLIHKDSPDNRGIDVALLYQPKAFKPLCTEFIKVNFPEKHFRPTRDILYTKGLTKDRDTIHIFINHWPSRWGGQLETEDKRMFTASVVKRKVDSINSNSLNANIIIIGDLNDFTTNKSLTKVLQANNSLEQISPNKLYNLSHTLEHTLNLGSHKYQGKWGILDQIIVSGSLLQNQTLYTSIEKAGIFNASFLIENDESNIGKRPFRTYRGYKYIGGYSDHLPVFFDLLKGSKQCNTKP